MPRPSRSTPNATSHRVVADTWRRDLLVALSAGLAVLAFVIYAFISLSRQSTASGGVEGTITAKNFVPQQETQITIGRAGVSSRRSAGEYSFQVRVAEDNNRIYKVTVDPLVYNAHAVGDRFYFVRGPAPISSAPPAR